MSTEPSSVETKMWSIFAKQKKNTLFITLTTLTNERILYLDHLLLPRWRSLYPLQNLRLKVSRKNKEISSKHSMMASLCDKSFYKSFLTKTTKMTIQVQRSQLQNHESVIYRTLKILMIYNKSKIKTKEKSLQRFLAFAKMRAIILTKIFLLQGKTRLSVDTIHYSFPTMRYSSTVPTYYYSWTVLMDKIFKRSIE